MRGLAIHSRHAPARPGRYWIVAIPLRHRRRLHLAEAGKRRWRPINTRDAAIPKSRNRGGLFITRNWHASPHVLPCWESTGVSGGCDASSLRPLGSGYLSRLRDPGLMPGCEALDARHSLRLGLRGKQECMPLLHVGHLPKGHGTRHASDEPAKESKYNKAR